MVMIHIHVMHIGEDFSFSYAYQCTLDRLPDAFKVLFVAVCCSAMRCVARSPSLDSCKIISVAVCCSVLQCVAVRCSMLHDHLPPTPIVFLLQCVAACYNELQCVAPSLSRLLEFSCCCIVLHCVALCCNVLQHVVRSPPPDSYSVPFVAVCCRESQ